MRISSSCAVPRKDTKRRFLASSRQTPAFPFELVVVVVVVAVVVGCAVVDGF